MGFIASGLKGTALEDLGQKFGEGVSNAFSSAANSVNEQVSAAGENFNDFTKAIFGDVSEAGTPASIAQDVVKTVSEDVSDPGGILQRKGEALQEFGSNLAKGIDEGDTFIPEGTISKLQSVLPDLAGTAALGLSSKLLNSAMGVAGGTAGQAVEKVAAPVVQAAQVATGKLGEAASSLKRPAGTKQTAAEISKALKKAGK